MEALYCGWGMYTLTATSKKEVFGGLQVLKLLLVFVYVFLICGLLLKIKFWKFFSCYTFLESRFSLISSFCLLSCFFAAFEVSIDLSLRSIVFAAF